MEIQANQNSDSLGQFFGCVTEMQKHSNAHRLGKYTQHRRKISFLWLPMAIPPTLLLRKLILESLLSSGPFTIFFPIARCLPLVIPPSSPPEPNMLSFHKSPWARFLMQFRPPNTSIP